MSRSIALVKGKEPNKKGSSTPKKTDHIHPIDLGYLDDGGGKTNKDHIRRIDLGHLGNEGGNTDKEVAEEA